MKYLKEMCMAVVMGIVVIVSELIWGEPDYDAMLEARGDII